jgi:uncharacterized protein DUF4058
MPSPFPGMDPYLEGYLWPDVHSALASKIRQQLTPLLRPRYTARLAVYVVEDPSPENEIGILSPDVEVLRPVSEAPSARSGPSHAPEAVPAGGITPAVLSIPVVLPVEARLVGVELRDTAGNRLIASIELLSPVNKREPGLTQYRGKRQRLYQSGVHLLELDLIRRGTRPVTHPRLADAAYVVALTRAHAGRTDVWPLGVRDPLPRVPVPLVPPDEDVPLDLGAALQAVYDEAAYDLSIDYGADPPPPPLSEADREWIRTLRPSESRG